MKFFANNFSIYTSALIIPLLILMNSFTEHARESKVAEECVTKCSIELPACENCSQIQQCLHDKKSAICKQVCMQLQAHEHQETKFDPEESCFQKIRFGLEPEITIKNIYWSAATYVPLCQNLGFGIMSSTVIGGLMGNILTLIGQLFWLHFLLLSIFFSSEKNQ